jgi:hypothetical protein
MNTVFKPCQPLNISKVLMETLESSGGLTALAANKAAQHVPIRMDKLFFWKKENILICICWQWQTATVSRTARRHSA